MGQERWGTHHTKMIIAQYDDGHRHSNYFSFSQALESVFQQQIS